MSYYKGQHKVWKFDGFGEVELTYIGRSSSGQVWRGVGPEHKGTTFLIGHDDGLDALSAWADCEEYDNLPNVRQWGYISAHPQEERKLYTFPWAQKISAKNNRRAWEQLKALKRLFDEAREEVFDNFRPPTYGNYGPGGYLGRVGLFVLETFRDKVYAEAERTTLIDRHLAAGIAELVGAMSTWGTDCCIDLSPGRVKVDEHGTLILQTVAFVPSQVR